MFSLAVLALATFASSNALVIPRSAPPPSYGNFLEDYTTYHIRYLALDCQANHGKKFFDDCCHPLLATENLKDNRKAYCTPSAKASSSASAAEPTSTVVPSGDDDCSDDDDDGDESSAANPTPPDNTAPDNAPPDNAPKNVAPDPSEDTSSSTSSTPSPSPTPKETPTPTAQPSPKPTPDQSSSESGLGAIVGQVFKGGIATFFFQNGVAGNCGTVHKDSDFIVALESSTYAGGIHCGKSIVIKDDKTGHTETATVADSCPTCNNPQSIDLSQSLFDAFAAAGDGTFPVEWAFKG